MINREQRGRPAPWQEKRLRATHKWMLPFVGLECFWEWVAFALSNWIFLEVLEYLGSVFGSGRSDLLFF